VYKLELNRIKELIKLMRSLQTNKSFQLKKTIRNETYWFTQKLVKKNGVSQISIIV